MSIADWIILGFLVFSVTAAAIEGFFHEAFKLAGLVVGYLLAAWQYHRLADWFAPPLKSPWLGEIAGFLIIFFAVLMVAGIAGQIARWAMKKAGLSTIDRFLGSGAGLVAGRPGGVNCADRHGRICTRRKVAGRLRIGPVFPGRRKSS